MQLKSLLAMLLLVFINIAGGQAQPTKAVNNRVSAVAAVSKRLQWNDESSRHEYLQMRDATTNELLREVDGFISESFNARSVVADRVKLSLDGLLGHKDGDWRTSIAITTDLPSGRFLVIGIQVPRGGPAIAEDAVSIRAYKAEGDKFVFVADTGRDLDNHFLNAKALSSPNPNEVWLIAWGDQPPRTPYSVALRVYAFDGKGFRTVWEPADITTGNVESAVQLAPNGFTIDRYDDDRFTRGESSYRLREEYILTRDGPRLNSSYYLPD